MSVYWKGVLLSYFVYKEDIDGLSCTGPKYIKSSPILRHGHAFETFVSCFQRGLKGDQRGQGGDPDCRTCSKLLCNMYPYRLNHDG